jgi:hypothetical protein
LFSSINDTWHLFSNNLLACHLFSSINDTWPAVKSHVLAIPSAANLTNAAPWRNGRRHHNKASFGVG